MHSNLNDQRIGDQTTFQAQIPQLARQQMLENLGAASQFESSIPKGTSTSGLQGTSQEGHQESVGTTPGNMTGGALGNLSETLAYLYGKGAFGGTQGASYTPTGGNLKFPMFN